MYKPEQCIDLDFEFRNSTNYLEMIVDDYREKRYENIKINLDKQFLFDEKLYQSVERLSNILTKLKVPKEKTFYSVSIQPNDKLIFDYKQWEQVLKFYNYLRENQTDLVFEDIQSLWSVQEVENANIKMNRVVNLIKHNSYSPLEKLLSVYLKVTSKKFKYSDNERQYSRSVYGILNSDNIVCVGYCELLREMLKQLGEENITIYDNDLEFKKPSGHENLIIKIKDEKYGIDGYYYLDPTWDNDNDQSKTTLNYFLMPLGELQNVNFKSYPSGQNLSYTTYGLFFNKNFLNSYLKDYPEQKEQVMQSFADTFYDERIKDATEKLKTLNFLYKLYPYLTLDQITITNCYLIDLRLNDDPKEIRKKVNSKTYKAKSLNHVKPYIEKFLNSLHKEVQNTYNDNDFANKIFDCLKSLLQEHDQVFLVKFYNFTTDTNEFSNYINKQIELVKNNEVTIDEFYFNTYEYINNQKIPHVDSSMFEIKKLINKYKNVLAVNKKEKQKQHKSTEEIENNIEKYNRHLVYDFDIDTVYIYKNDFIEKQMLKSSKPIPLSSIKQALQNVLHIEHSYKNDIVNERIEKILSNTKEYNALLYNKIPSRYNDDELSK